MRTSMTRLFTVVLLLCLLPVTSESEDVTGGGAVHAGHNPVKWKNGLAGNANVGVNATFTPAGDKLFAKESAVAASLGTDEKWNGNYENTESKAEFTTTIKPAEFKKYPTFFTGSFQYPKSQAAKPRQSSVPPQWLASGVLSDDGAHSYYHVITSDGGTSEADSGISFNGEKKHTKWLLPVNYDKKTGLAVTVNYVPITITVQELNNCALPPNALPDQIAAVKGPRKQLSEKIESAMLKKQQEVQAANNMPLSPEGHHTGAFTFHQHGEDLTVELIAGQTENGCECKGTPKLNPDCEAMTRMTYTVKISYDYNVSIYLPKLEYQGTPTAQAKKWWNEIYETIPTHERIHYNYRVDCAEQLRDLEKKKYTIEICSAELNLDVLKSELESHIKEMTNFCFRGVIDRDEAHDSK